MSEDPSKGKKFATNVTGPNGAPVQGQQHQQNNNNYNNKIIQKLQQQQQHQ